MTNKYNRIKPVEMKKYLLINDKYFYYYKLLDLLRAT